jgi:hypothetical protein
MRRDFAAGAEGAEQAMRKHMADARGCKGGDAGAVKSEVFQPTSV